MEQLQGQFPAAPSLGLEVLNDVGATGRTSGRQTILPLSAKPTIARPWTVYGLGVQGQGMLFADPGVPVYGALGKLYAALLVGGSFAPQSNAPFATLPLQALTSIVQLWDGATDAPFPFLPSTGVPPGGGYFSGSLQLPLPQTLGPSESLAIGLWLTPALANLVATIIYNTTWTILYDTRPPQ